MRALLCRPQGGLNDILCQIERVCRYAERFGRTVYVDTDFPGALSFRDAFSRYFISRQNRLILDIAEVAGNLDRLHVVPGILKSRVRAYDARYDPKLGNFVEPESGVCLSFNFDQDYAEDLLVHHACGGGNLSVDALARLRLHDNVTDTLIERLRQIGGPYTGIHIRHSDIEADYRSGIRELARMYSGSIVIATDSQDVLDECRGLWGPDRLHSFADLGSSRGQPLHHIQHRNDAYRRNLDAIVDLLLLALSSNFHTFPLRPNVAGLQFSGFSVLASNLRTARATLSRLIDRRDPLLSRLVWPVA